VSRGYFALSPSRQKHVSDGTRIQLDASFLFLSRHGHKSDFPERATMDSTPISNRRKKEEGVWLYSYPSGNVLSVDVSCSCELCAF
jgi:hypothetical protein